MCERERAREERVKECVDFEKELANVSKGIIVSWLIRTKACVRE